MSARPWLRFLDLLRGSFCVDRSLTAVAPARRDDAPRDAVPVAPIGIHDGEADAVLLSDCHHPLLAVVPPAILNLDGHAVEYQGRECEIEPAILQVHLTLALVPREPHMGVYRSIYIRPGPRLSAPPATQARWEGLAAGRRFPYSARRIHVEALKP